MDESLDLAMRILITTNHVAEFSGSETIVFELATEMAALGHEVTVAANYIANPLRDFFPDSISFLSLQDAALAGYDLVWSQHDTAASLLDVMDDYSAMPLIVSVCLSPFEPFEFPDLLFRRRIGCPLFVNSPETRDHLHQLDPNRMTTVFSNACPRAYFETAASGSDVLKSITFISNHNANGVDLVAEALSKQGIAVRRIGILQEYTPISPAVFAGTDAVVTIGKSVIYALASGTPAFLLDIWGCGGWLSAENMARHEHYNFSGRPDGADIAPDEIVAQIIEGYVAARGFAERFRREGDLRRFDLRTHIGHLVIAAGSDEGRRQFCENIARAMADHEFRLHLRSMKAKNSIIAREYRHARRRR